MKRGFPALGAAAIVVVMLIALAALPGVDYTGTTTPTPTVLPTAKPQVEVGLTNGLKQFNTFNEVEAFLKTSQGNQYGYYGGMMRGGALGAAPMMEAAATDSKAGGSDSIDYSTTNVQIAGVDEADILKNDGKYLYTITQGKLVILQAYPAGEAKVVLTLNDSQYSNLFVLGDRLVAFGYDEYNWDPIVKPYLEAAAKEETTTEPANGMMRKMIAPGEYYPYYYSGSNFIKVFDMSDRSNLKLLKRFDLRGNVAGARLIGNRVYVISNENAYWGYPRPLYAVDGKEAKIAASEIAYVDYPFDSYSFTTVIGFDATQLDKQESRKVVLMGYGSNVFVSSENAYVTYTSYQSFKPVWSAYEQAIGGRLTGEWAQKIAAVDASDESEWRKDSLKVTIAAQYLSQLTDEKEKMAFYNDIYTREQEIRQTQYTGEQTVVHKFSLGESIEYKGRGEVPGSVLNQFSMDEFEGNFRIATTTQPVYSYSRRLAVPDGAMMPIWIGDQKEIKAQENHVFVLNEKLETIGKLTGLAPGERIYSARFMGKRAYLVTFKQVDPLFVIGFDDPTQPKLLGELKIPGYSQYLHPFGEKYLIGFGKDAVGAEKGDFAYYLGLKLSLFDVSDVANPREVAVYPIGDRGSESYALNDHHAFTFDAKRGLLVLPVLYAEIDKSKPTPAGDFPPYGQYKFQGAYVFNVNEQGFTLKGTVGHAQPDELASQYDYWGSGTNVQRSAYIGDVLYTISESLVKATDLNSFETLASVKLPYTRYNYGYAIESDLVR